MIDAAGGCEDALGEVEVTGEEDWQEFAEQSRGGKGVSHEGTANSMFRATEL